MPFQKIENNICEIRETFKKEISQAIKLDKEGIIIRADSLGSLEALVTLLKQENIKIVKAGIGNVSKSDVISARANIELNPLNSIILGFNVKPEEELKANSVKILTNNVIYKLIDELKTWRIKRQAEIEKERLMELSPICKLEILHEYVFRNLNPAIFGVRVLCGKLKTGMKLINEQGDEVARVKSMQLEKESINEVEEENEVAIALPGVNFERKLKEAKFLYSEISAVQFKKLKQNKDLLSQKELRILQEIADIKRKKDEGWGE
jgi:translation initiation factor 5B